MKAEDWQLIERLFHEARELRGNARVRFLEEQCRGDSHIRCTMDSLLQHEPGASEFLPVPAAELMGLLRQDDGFDGSTIASVGKGDTVTLPPGTRIGPYEIVDVAGIGGMGQVYRARDGRLQRDVAIKVVPTTIDTASGLPVTFARESTILASMNHPNIAAIYDVFPGDRNCCLVLEFIEGPTLAERLRQGSMPIAVALVIARQIAIALEAAHDKGIVHRDLKPANIKITPDGNVKVLDFGLAKAHASTSSLANTIANCSATLSPQMSFIQGTPGYMSPEQARGEAVDLRTDIWAFGCVLYEMLTQGKMFSPRGQSSRIDIGASSREDFISNQIESITLQGFDLSPRIERLLRKCLEVKPERRYQSMHELQEDLVPPDETGFLAGHRKRLIAAAGILAVLVMVSFLVSFFFAVNNERSPQLMGSPAYGSAPEESQLESIVDPFLPATMGAVGARAIQGSVTPVSDEVPTTALSRTPAMSVMQSPEVLVSIAPEYPPLARLARIEGTVAISGFVTENGMVDDIKVTSGHPFLIDAALACVRQWRYSAAKLNGTAVRAPITIEVRFALTRPD